MLKGFAAGALEPVVMLNAPTELQRRLVQCYFDGQADQFLVDELVRDELPVPTLRLLSAVLRTVQEQHPGRRELDKLQGQLRYFWVVQQLQQQALNDILQRFASQAIPALVIGGTALSMGYYPKASSRSSGELDLLISAHLASQVEAELLQSGWTAIAPLHPALQPIQMLSKYSKGAGVKLNVHWKLYPDQNPASLDGLFARSTSLALRDGLELRGLDPHDQLLWLLVDGRRGIDGGPQVQWILDCLLIVRQSSIDWDRVVQASIQENVWLPLRDGLSILGQSFGLIVPAACLRRLRAQPFGLARQLDYFARAQAPGQRRLQCRLWLLWRDYRRLNLDVPLGLRDFLALRWNCVGGSGLFRAALNRLRSRSGR